MQQEQRARSTEPNWFRRSYCGDRAEYRRLETMGHTMLGTILIVLLILALVGAFPRWGYSRGWGYGPSGLVGVLLIVVLVLALSGQM
jgi:Protein of unknown function (DUF3309)